MVGVRINKGEKATHHVLAFFGAANCLKPKLDKKRRRGHMRIIIGLLFLGLFSLTGFSQVKQKSADVRVIAPNQASTLTAAKALAVQALEAHGGEKYREMKTLVVSGDVDLTASVINQAVPATFLTIFSGEKYRLEIDNPFQPLKQAYDGERTYTSVSRGFTFPPINRLGLPLLQKLGDDGFVVSELAKKKKLGFRITSPEGYFTDFYLNKKTHRVKGYDSSYIVGSREVTTAVEISKYEETNGVLIPRKYAQRFDLGEITVYAEFKAKEILVNTEVDDGAFRIN